MNSQPKPFASTPRAADDKILTRADLIDTCRSLKRDGRRIVFTNGCYDILHAGHVRFLAAARSLGDHLVVGLNSDASVRRLKGPTRPVNSQDDRLLVIASLESVDSVALFDEDEPAALIGDILPDTLVKGSDWEHYVSGRDIVEQHGGKVVLLPLIEGKSTTATIARITASTP